MTAKHTPGPWFYQENSDAYTHIVRAASKPNLILVQLRQDTSGGAEADARLIAAAPTMFDALATARQTIYQDRKNMFDCHVNFHTGEVGDELGRAGIAAYDLVLRQIDAAMAIATGSPA